MNKETNGKPVKNKVTYDKVRVGDLMCFSYWAKVENQINRNGLRGLQVRNVDNTQPFDVLGSDLIEEAYSADRYVSEEKVNKTGAAEILINARNIPFTVEFEKSNGEYRTLRGRLVAPEPLLGRSMVEDLDIKEAHKLRQIDHRTISYIICNGVKYTVK